MLIDIDRLFKVTSKLLIIIVKLSDGNDCSYVSLKAEHDYAVVFRFYRGICFCKIYYRKKTLLQLNICLCLVYVENQTYIAFQFHI